MNAKKLLFVSVSLLTCILLWGCRGDRMLDEPRLLPEPEEASPSPLCYSVKDHVLTEDAIRLQATNLLSLLKDAPLRGGRRAVESITPIYGYDHKLRGGREEEAPAPLLYVVNFTNNAGYTVLSADARLDPVWLLAPEGHLDIDQAPDNPTFLMLMQQLELAYNLKRYKMIEAKKIPTGEEEEAIKGATPSPYYEYGPWKHIPEEKYESLIPVVWGQTDDPYSRFINPKISKHAGCVTAAVAQIMAFHRYPCSYNWPEMLKHRPLSNPGFDYDNEDARNEIGRLYRQLGISLKVRYKPEGSPAHSEDVPNTFRAFGYTNGGCLRGFSLPAIQNDLRRAPGKGYPVYISACDSMFVRYKHFLWWKWKKVSYGSGHAFVIDGVSKARREVRKFDGSTHKELARYYETVDLLHANLGWNDAYHNGYYNKDIFDTNNAPLLRSMSKSVYGEKDVYRYNFKIITGIRP